MSIYDGQSLCVFPQSEIVKEKCLSLCLKGQELFSELLVFSIASLFLILGKINNVCILQQKEIKSHQCCAPDSMAEFGRSRASQTEINSVANSPLIDPIYSQEP